MKLYNGVEIPFIGFGTYRMPVCDTASGVRCALETGWRHVDTATIYENEAEVGQGLRESGVPRGEVFLTTKVQGCDRGYESTHKAFELSCKRMQVDYVDLYLIHWPASPFFHDDWKKQNADTWRACEELYEAGKVRAIGVSNFMPRHLEELAKTARIVPMVNQIEFHPGWMQKDCLEYCKEHDILVEAWAPFIKGAVLSHPVIGEIAARHNCSVAQVILGWVLACGVLPLCRSNNPEHIAGNLHPAELTAEEVAILSGLHDCGGRCYNPDCCNF